MCEVDSGLPGNTVYYLLLGPPMWLLPKASLLHLGETKEPRSKKPQESHSTQKEGQGPVPRPVPRRAWVPGLQALRDGRWWLPKDGNPLRGRFSSLEHWPSKMSPYQTSL